jgi:hypothetical protein
VVLLLNHAQPTMQDKESKPRKALIKQGINHVLMA